MLPGVSLYDGLAAPMWHCSCWRSSWAPTPHEGCERQYASTRLVPPSTEDFSTNTKAESSMALVTLYACPNNIRSRLWGLQRHGAPRHTSAPALPLTCSCRNCSLCGEMLTGKSLLQGTDRTSSSFMSLEYMKDRAFIPKQNVGGCAAMLVVPTIQISYHPCFFGCVFWTRARVLSPDPSA